jgi:23S rRNA-/tRNA-specific pseudouridylate synthase
MVESSKKTTLGKRKRTEDMEVPKEDKDEKSTEEIKEKIPTYYYRNGLRFVKSYYHEFTCFTKARWVGKSLIEVYSTEFKAYSKDYYEKTIENGKIHINGNRVGLNYNLKDGDKIIHEVLRIETPVLEEMPIVMFENDDFLAVNKPSSMTVHPCGNFCYNTL